ncbi:MAG TPA: metallophosphoesterase family protein [Casimicrobiaceae bacterium]|nr:metallophosphoesterase family protein [Casimicrobiaceae bacterium]
MKLRVGIISDTHGLLRPEALRALAGSDHIVHAGDIGAGEILDQLRDFAPVTAVRGNNDTAAWARAIPDSAVLRVGEISIYVLHALKALSVDSARAGHRVVVSGHSHRPLVIEREGVLYVNPGSAGPRRFSLPIAIAHLDIDGMRVHARIVQLETASKGTRL